MTRCGMTDTTGTTTEETDTKPEPLWMVPRPGGDVIIKWEDMTLAEQQKAYEHHNKMYGIEQ